MRIQEERLLHIVSRGGRVLIRSLAHVAETPVLVYYEVNVLYSLVMHQGE